MLENKLFEVYFELLIRRNREFNLTTIVEREDVYLKHFEDSLAALSFIDEGAEVIDIGSGPGFPGLPLKIVRDDILLTMVESTRKKADFLKEAVDVLGLSGCTVLNSRAEDLPKTKLYDCGVARAVARTATIAEYILPFIKVGGIMIAYKARDVETEASEAKKAIKILGGEIEHIERMMLGGMERNLIIIRKIAPTSPKYPRAGNKPRIMPLS